MTFTHGLEGDDEQKDLINIRELLDAYYKFKWHLDPGFLEKTTGLNEQIIKYLLFKQFKLFSDETTRESNESQIDPADLLVNIAKIAFDHDPGEEWSQFLNNLASFLINDITEPTVFNKMNRARIAIDTGYHEDAQNILFAIGNNEEHIDELRNADPCHIAVLEAMRGQSLYPRDALGSRPLEPAIEHAHNAIGIIAKDCDLGKLFELFSTLAAKERPETILAVEAYKRALYVLTPHRRKHTISGPAN